MIVKVDEETIIYLKRGVRQWFEIFRVGEVQKDVNFVVAYDLIIDGQVFIPRGTRVTGNWETNQERTNTQLQINRIFLQPGGQDFMAHSKTFGSEYYFMKDGIKYFKIPIHELMITVKQLFVAYPKMKRRYLLGGINKL